LTIPPALLERRANLPGTARQAHTCRGMLIRFKRCNSRHGSAARTSDTKVKTGLVSDTQSLALRVLVAETLPAAFLIFCCQILLSQLDK